MTRLSSQEAVAAFLDVEPRSKKDRMVWSGLRALCAYLSKHPEAFPDFEPADTWERFGERNPYNSSPSGRAGWAFALADSNYADDKKLPVIFEKRRDPLDGRQNQYRLKSALRAVLVELCK